jgi:hypothetical protein
MWKSLAIIVCLTPSLAHSGRLEDGCKALSNTSFAIALGRDYGLKYENALDWVAGLEFVTPWSELLASTVEIIYSKTYIGPKEFTMASYISCIETLGELN